MTNDDSYMFTIVNKDYPPWNKQFAPENRPSQKETSIPTIQFFRCELLVSGWVRHFGVLLPIKPDIMEGPMLSDRAWLFIRNP